MENNSYRSEGTVTEVIVFFVPKNTHQYCCDFLESHNYHDLSVSYVCRSHSWLLWREPDCDWWEGHSWYLCHLSCSIPLSDSWIFWPGSIESLLKLYSYNSPSSNKITMNAFFYWMGFYAVIFLDWCFCSMCVSGEGIWHSDATTVPYGSIRPEEQTSASRKWACICGFPGASHWHFFG